MADTQLEKCSSCTKHLPDEWDLDVCGPCLVEIREKEYSLADKLLKIALNDGMRDWKALKAKMGTD